MYVYFIICINVFTTSPVEICIHTCIHTYIHIYRHLHLLSCPYVCCLLLYGLMQFNSCFGSIRNRHYFVFVFFLFFFCIFLYCSLKFNVKFYFIFLFCFCFSSLCFCCYCCYCCNITESFTCAFTNHVNIVSYNIIYCLKALMPHATCVRLM